MTKDNQRIQNRATKERKITNSTDMSWVDVKNVHVACTKQHSWHQCFKWKWNAPSSVCWHARQVARTGNVGSKQASFAPKAEITHPLPLLDTLISFFFFYFYFLFFSRFGAASEVICYIPRPFCPRFCEGKNKSHINSLSSTTQPKPALLHSAALDPSISSDCILVWMSTISRFSCTDPAVRKLYRCEEKCNARHTQKQGMGGRGQDLLEQTEGATEARWHQVRRKYPLKALADNNMQQHF